MTIKAQIMFVKALLLITNHSNIVMGVEQGSERDIG